jgi:hypothetical protein
MAEKIDILDVLPPDMQEEILEFLSIPSDAVTIEIDKERYTIPAKVNELIDRLYCELEDFKDEIQKHQG